MNKTVGLHCKIKSLFHETKQFNFPEKNVWEVWFLRSKLAILQSQLKNPHLAKLHLYSALSLMEKALGKTLPCRPHFTQIRF